MGAGTGTEWRGALATCLLLALSAPPAAAQDAERDRGAEATTESADAEATGFLVADGTFGGLPETAPEPGAKPLDPEDRPEVEVADAEAGELPEDGPAPSSSSPSSSPPSSSPLSSSPSSAEAIGPEDLPDAPETATSGDAPDPADIPPVRRQLAESDAEFAQCTAALAELGTLFEESPPLTETRDPDCGIARPITVSEIVPGIALRPDAIMRCATARALAEWVATDVRPAADELGAEVTAIDHGSTYICRRRNNRPTGKLSEHSFGNAVDVMGFRFAARDPVRIEPREPGGPVATFQRTVREASCEHFTTVIGPGTDAAHADHIHLDIKQRRGDYRLCQ